MDVSNATIRAVFASVDDVVLECIFVVRACVMKSVPAFLQGAYCSAMRVALRWADRDRDSRDIVRQTRASCFHSSRDCCCIDHRGAVWFRRAVYVIFSLRVIGSNSWFTIKSAQISLLSLYVAGAVVIVVMTRNEGRTERRFWCKCVNRYQVAMFLN